MDDLDALARLTARVENLEHRISVLEHPSETAASVPAEPATPATLQPTAEAFPSAEAGGVFPVLGKAMLGIAGAYVLRAVAESGSFPKLAVVVLALAYAGMWLVWAARVRLRPLCEYCLCHHSRLDPRSHALGTDPAI